MHQLGAWGKQITGVRQIRRFLSVRSSIDQLLSIIVLILLISFIICFLGGLLLSFVLIYKDVTTLL
jgi:hypothetical protein